MVSIGLINSSIFESKYRSKRVRSGGVAQFKCRIFKINSESKDGRVKGIMGEDLKGSVNGGQKFDL